MTLNPIKAGDLVAPDPGTILVTEFGVGAAFADQQGVDQTPILVLDFEGRVNGSAAITQVHLIVTPDQGGDILRGIYHAIEHLAGYLPPGTEPPPTP